MNGDRTPSDKRSALDRALRCKLHLPAGERGAGWQQRREVERLLAALPAALLGRLAEAACGHIVVWSGPSGYEPGAWQHGPLSLCGVALINADELARRADPPLCALAGLVDHLIGSVAGDGDEPLTGRAAGAWGGFPGRLVAAQSLAHAGRPAGESPSAYFAWALARYLADGRGLSVADPAVHRLLRSTVFSEAYWRGHPPRPSGEAT